MNFGHNSDWKISNWIRTWRGSPTTMQVKTFASFHARLSAVSSPTLKVTFRNVRKLSETWMLRAFNSTKRWSNEISFVWCIYPCVFAMSPIQRTCLNAFTLTFCRNLGKVENVSWVEFPGSLTGVLRTYFALMSMRVHCYSLIAKSKWLL